MIVYWRQGKDLQLLQHRRGVAALSVFHRILYSLSPVALHDLRPCSAPTTRSTSRATRPPVFARPGTNKPNYWLSSFILFMTSTWNKIVPTNLQTQSDPQKFKCLINSSLDLPSAPQNLQPPIRSPSRIILSPTRFPY